MKISSRTEYGVKALMDLAQHYGGAPVQSKEIAERQLIPEAYLNQLLIALRKGGMIRSVRGPGGGHALAKVPSQIDLAQVVDVLEGASNVSSARDATGDGELPERRVICSIWKRAQEASRSVLRSVTLEDMLQEKRRLEHQIIYYI